MLVTFTTAAYTDITMFGDVAVSLLKMLGHSGTVPGALRAEDIPAALGHLRAALATESGNERCNMAPGADDEPDIDISTERYP